MQIHGVILHVHVLLLMALTRSFYHHKNGQQKKCSFMKWKSARLAMCTYQDSVTTPIPSFQQPYWKKYPFDFHQTLNPKKKRTAKEKTVGLTLGSHFAKDSATTPVPSFRLPGRKRDRFHFHQTLNPKTKRTAPKKKKKRSDWLLGSPFSKDSANRVLGGNLLDISRWQLFSSSWVHFHRRGGCVQKSAYRMLSYLPRLQWWVVPGLGEHRRSSKVAYCWPLPLGRNLPLSGQ